MAEACSAPGASQLHSAFGSELRSWSMRCTLISAVENSLGWRYGPSHHTDVAEPCRYGRHSQPKEPQAQSPHSTLSEA